MTTKNRIKTVLTLAAVAMALFASVAQAALLVYEPFDYADGWLNGQGGALGTTGTWTTTDTVVPEGWRVHPEGELTGIVIEDVDCTPNVFDGTVDNLPTSGAFVGAPGPEDRGLAPCFDHGAGKQDASIGLDPSVTATFTSGTTTWFSFVSVHAWDRNQVAPQFMIGTDPTPENARGMTMLNSGNGIGGGGGPPNSNRPHIYPMYFEGGIVNNLNAEITSWTQNDDAVPEDSRMDWVQSDDDGFGAANIIVGKIEWDADTGGEDILTVVRFLEDEAITLAAFNALVAAEPNLSSANWAGNKPSLDQSLFDTLNFSSAKAFVDEIRIATTFEDVIGGTFDPNLPYVDAGINMITWSGQAVPMDPTIVEAPGSDWTSLTYLWTAEPNGIGDPNLDVAITGADTENASVKITKTATGDATVVTMTLAVNSDGRTDPPVTDAMTIDVYDDACLAALDLGLAVIDSTDVDENCITNFKDFALLAATWLDDYTLTDPVAK